MSRVIPFPPRQSRAGTAITDAVVDRSPVIYNDCRVSTHNAPVLQANEPFVIGEWLVEPSLNRLSRGGISVQLELKAMDVLLCLVSRHGEVVTKHELLDAVWQTEFVSDNSLQRRVADLREALGDSAHSPRYIETIRKRGYRLIAELSAMDHRTASVPSFPESPTTPEGEINPYPGLAAFTEADSELFFGREAETAELLRTITSRRLLAVIGPSGIGKSSLLRAGVSSRAPPDWRVLVFTPGESPALSLARALAPDHAGDPAAVSKLVGFTDPDIALVVVSRWRARFERAVLVVDQFEELFTLNPREVQASFVGLLRRLVDKAEVNVVLAMRDDFLYRCRDFPQIKPIFKDLTPLGPPAPEALRRALIEPAAQRLHRFESEVLVDRMVAEVEDQRSALPLLAFAVHRLWEERDREARLLTEAAYDRIGGVGGALARHAEAVVAEIGHEGLPVVREIFRNLVTAEGTRAVREWDELLSVFGAHGKAGAHARAGINPASEAAEQVLRELVDARLLTSYEVHEEDDEPTRRIEISHESLLASWPRLVRWRTQDAEGALLRDQLRQAARTWDEHEQSDDLLWIGTAYREYRLWREHYPGGLSATEEAFGAALTRHATRRRRRRRSAAAATLCVLLAVVAVVGGFWRHSIAEARRADAANLFSLAQLELEEHPSATIAHAIASLELADNPEVRRLALEALWKGPTELRLWTGGFSGLRFSADGRWLGTASPDHGAKLWPSDGGPATILEGSPKGYEARFSPRGDLVAANMDDERTVLGLWSFPEGRFLRSFALGDGMTTFFFFFSSDGHRLVTSSRTGSEESTELVIRSWPVTGGEPDHLARFSVDPSSNSIAPVVDQEGSHLAWADGRRVVIAPLGVSKLDLAAATSIEHDRAIASLDFGPRGSRLVTEDKAGTIRVWSLERDPPELRRTFGAAGVGSTYGRLRFDPCGSILASVGNLLWDLRAPPDAEPVRLRRPGKEGFGYTFGPKGSWFATNTGGSSVSMWPLTRTYPSVLRGHEEGITAVAFTPDGERLVSASEDGSVRVWPLSSDSGEKSRVLGQVAGLAESFRFLAMAPDGSFVLAASQQGWVSVLPLDGGSGRKLHGFTDMVSAVAAGPEARLVAGGSGMGVREQAVVRVWDLESEEVRVLDAGDGLSIKGLEFTGEGDLWVSNWSRLRRWDLDVDPPRILEDFDFSRLGFEGDDLWDVHSDRRQALLKGPDTLRIVDLDTFEVQELASHTGPGGCGLNGTGEIVLSTDRRGGIRVGPTSGEQPHLLLGHEGEIGRLGHPFFAFSPDGRWIATGARDATIRLWPMPDLSKPPLHTLPREELIAKLETLTNLRVVRDEQSTTGWRLEVGRFPGWKTAPEW